MSARTEIEAHRAAILAAAERYGARNVRLLGSVAADRAGPGSDVDLLVRWDVGRSLYDVAGLKLELERLLGRKVDLLSDQDLHWYVRDAMLGQAQPL